MNARVFVDTNVFVYVRGPRDAAKQARAEQWIARLWRDRVGRASMQACEVLLSEDLQDGAAYGGITVRNPFTFDVREPIPAYAVMPSAAARHRGRGRPRKNRVIASGPGP